MIYLEFEKEIEQIDKKIDSAKNISERKILENKKKALLRRIYNKLDCWQQVQVARHQDRPYSLDYINYIFKDFFEVHGDRVYEDDPAIVAGFGYLGTYKLAIIGQQKGRTPEEREFRKYGMPNPSGYYKALRVSKLAEKFNLPIVIFIDTPGAFAGFDAEKHGQAFAIANNILQYFKIKTPIISIIIGEGGSGGALALGIADKLYMLKYSIFSVISPESCSSILFRTSDKKVESANLLKLTAKYAKRFGLIDGIIYEPPGGAHRYFKETALRIKNQIKKDLIEFNKVDIDNLIKIRKEKYLKKGDNFLERKY